MKPGLVAYLVVLTFSGVAAHAEAASFHGVGYLPGGGYLSEIYGLSGNGNVAVGTSATPDGAWAVKWALGEGLTPLGALPDGRHTTRANAASYDGSTIVGGAGDGDITAFKWTPQTGAVSLGTYGGRDIYAGGCSGDGSRITGGCIALLDWHAWVWTENGFQRHDYGHDTVITGISADGRWIAGWCQVASGGPFMYQAFRKELGEQTEFITSTDPDHSFGFEGISPDGATFVGVEQETHWGTRAFRWTAEGGTVYLGDLPGGRVRSVAEDVSCFGETIVGYSSTDLGLEAFIWDASYGMRNLRSVLENDWGLDLTGWVLQSATAISDDGTVIAGYGCNPAGDVEGWVAVIPEPATSAFAALAALALIRRKRRAERGQQAGPATRCTRVSDRGIRRGGV